MNMNKKWKAILECKPTHKGKRLPVVIMRIIIFKWLKRDIQRAKAKINEKQKRHQEDKAIREQLLSEKKILADDLKRLGRVFGKNFIIEKGHSYSDYKRQKACVKTYSIKRNHKTRKVNLKKKEQENNRLKGKAKLQTNKINKIKRKEESPSPTPKRTASCSTTEDMDEETSIKQINQGSKFRTIYVPVKANTPKERVPALIISPTEPIDEMKGTVIDLEPTDSDLDDEQRDDYKAQGTVIETTLPPGRHEIEPKEMLVYNPDTSRYHSSFWPTDSDLDDEQRADYKAPKQRSKYFDLEP